MKRVISVLLACALAASAAMTSLAATFTDTEQVKSWAETPIEYLVEKGVLNGRGDGTFDPQTSVKRVEFIKMLDETFGLTETTKISYSDVKEGDWFYTYVARAAKQGYLLAYGTQLNPDGYLTRQEAAALLARYLDLDPDNAAPSSTYPDYSSIKAAYRDYVLQATAEGLFNGLDDGNFHPDSYLTRAQAAVILARAAGTIYTASGSGRDAKAISGHGVITRGGVALDATQIDGRLIIGEGAQTGTVTLYGCTIDTLIVRGTSPVSLSDTTVKNLIVDVTDASSVTISLSSGSTVQNAVLETSARINIATRTEIDSLTVEKTARNASVIGAGTLNMAHINATGFSADYVPAKYEIADGLTATFAQTSYSGSSSKVENTGFTAMPETYSSSNSCYMTAAPAVTGTLYYYYTTSASAPTVATFDSYYNASALRGSYAVTKGTSADKNIGTIASVGAYPYVVVMLRDTAGNTYNPLLVSNKTSSGFTVAPTVTTANAYHTLSYTPSASGTVYYYYTNTQTAPTAASFTSTYNASSTSNKGTLTAHEGQSASNMLLSTSLVSSYAYIAVCLEDVSGEKYQPVLVSTAAQAVGTGFNSTPTSSIANDSITVSVNATAAGTVQYYFTTSSVAPTAAQFDSNLAMVQASLSGTKTVRQGANTLTLASTSTVAEYPYLVLRMTSGVNRYEPVVISASGVSLDLTGTGFNSIPTATAMNGYIYLNLNTSAATQVYYYLTNSATATSSTFTKNYQSATANNLTTKTGGAVTTSGYSQTGLQTIITTAQAASYKYIAIMIATNTSNGYWGTGTGTSSSFWGTIGGSTTQTNTGYTPIVIPVPAASSTTADSTTVFLSGPSYNIYMPTRHQIEFTTNKAGRVYYYYTDSTTDFDADKAVGEVLFGTASATTLCGSTTVRAGVSSAIPVDVGTSYPKYVAMIFVDENNTTYTPIFLTTDGASSSSSFDNGFNGTPTVTRASSTETAKLTVSTTNAGTVYYYFSSTSSAPTDSAAFFTNYNNTFVQSLRGSVSVGYGMSTVDLTTTYSSANYPYVVLLFQNANGGTGGYHKPLIVTVNASSSSSSSGFTTTPTLYGSTLYYTPATTGTLYYTFTNETTMSGLLKPIQSIISLGGTLGTGNVTYQSISSLIAQYGGGGSTAVTMPGYQRSLTLTSTANVTGYKYVAVWMVPTAGTSMSEAAFLPITGSSIGTGTGIGTGTTGSGLVGQTSSSAVFVTQPTIQNGYLNVYTTQSGTLYYAYSATNSASSWNMMVQSAISSGRYGNQNISAYIAQQGGGSSASVTTTGYYQPTQLALNYTGYSYPYIAVWMASPTMISEPVFIQNTTTGWSTGTGSTAGIGNGFAMGPTCSNGIVSFYLNTSASSNPWTTTTNAMTVVRYVLTNANSVTAADFDTYYNQLNAVKGSIAATDGFNTIDLTQYKTSGTNNPLYSYIWVLVETYSMNGMNGATKTSSYSPVQVLFN